MKSQILSLFCSKPPTDSEHSQTKRTCLVPHSLPLWSDPVSPRCLRSRSHRSGFLPTCPWTHSLPRALLLLCLARPNRRGQRVPLLPFRPPWPQPLLHVYLGHLSLLDTEQTFTSLLALFPEPRTLQPRSDSQWMLSDSLIQLCFVYLIEVKHL